MAATAGTIGTNSLEVPQIEVGSIQRPSGLGEVAEAGIQKDAVDESGKIAGLGIGDLISAAHVCLSFAEPRELPREADGGSDVVPVVLVESAAGIQDCWVQQVRSASEDSVDGNVRPQPLIEASAGNAEHRDTAADWSRRESIVFVGCAVKLIPDAKVQSERWPDLPVVLEEYGPVVLMSPREFPVVIEIALPLRVLGIVDVVILLSRVEGTGKEIEQAVRNRLIVGHQARHCGVIRESLVRILARAAKGLRDRSGRGFITLRECNTDIHTALERVLPLGPGQRVRILVQRRVVALLGATRSAGETDGGQRPAFVALRRDGSRVVDDRNAVASTQHERQRNLAILFIRYFPRRPNVVPVCAVAHTGFIEEPGVSVDVRLTVNTRGLRKVFDR